MPKQTRQRLKVENSGDITVVHFADKKILDKPNIQEIGDQLFHLVDDLGRSKLLLDFSNVEYLSSAALGKLITLQKKVEALGGWLVLGNVEVKIHEVFKTARLDKILEIHQRVEGDLAVGLARLLAQLKTRAPARRNKSASGSEERLDADLDDALH